MSNSFHIFVVDDDPIISDVLHAILATAYTVELFESAEDCARRLGDQQPDLFLLDVSLPGMDGYEFCRELRDSPNTHDIPVIFISANDTIDARLAGYDAGGEDFIVKPFNPEEIGRKVKVARSLQETRKQMVEKIQDTELMSDLFFTNMNEYIVLVQLQGKMAGCETGDDVAEAVLQALHNYKLEGAVQVRLSTGEITLSRNGRDMPLDVSVLNHVRTMERIFEFRKYGVYNFKHITILINNMPLDDPDQCGRIRDNLAIAAQGADTHLIGLQSDIYNQNKQRGIAAVVKDLNATIGALKEIQGEDRAKGASIIHQLQKDLINSFVHLGLSDRQERILEDLVNERLTELVTLYDRAQETQDVLGRLGEQLNQLGTRSLC